jgi:hypothetical protein
VVPECTISKPLADFPSESRTLQWLGHRLHVFFGGDDDSQAVDELPVTGSDRISAVRMETNSMVEISGKRMK